MKRVLLQCRDRAREAAVLAVTCVCVGLHILVTSPRVIPATYSVAPACKRLRYKRDLWTRLLVFQTSDLTNIKSNATMSARPYAKHKDESATDAVHRIFKGVNIPSPTYRALTGLAVSHEHAKGQLRERLQERKIENKNLNGRNEEMLSALFVLRKDNEEPNAMLTDAQSALETERARGSGSENWKKHEHEMQKLKDELELTRNMRSDDDSLVKLYVGGTNLVKKQTDELNSLKDENTREQTRNHQLSRLLALQMSNNKEEKAALVETVQRLEGRLASLTAESTDAEADLRHKLAESEQQAKAAFALASKLQDKMTAVDEAVEQSSDSTLASADTAELREEISILKQRCESYRSMMDEQEKLVEKLEEENWKLVNDW